MSPENQHTNISDPNQQYLNIVSRMEGSYRSGSITYFDEASYDFYSFCLKYPQYIPNGLTVEEFTKNCDRLIDTIWGWAGGNQINHEQK
jgi:hypothetical protein